MHDGVSEFDAFRKFESFSVILIHENDRQLNDALAGVTTASDIYRVQLLDSLSCALKSYSEPI